MLMKTKKKRLLSILLTLAMVLGLMSGMTLTAYAEGDITPYPLRVGGVQVTSANLTIDSQDNEAISGSAVYDDSTNTLTLTNFSYTGPGYGGEWGLEGGGIDYRDSEGSDLTIVLEGTNSITKSGDNSIRFSHGIYFGRDGGVGGDGTLTIDGPGSLTIGFDASRQGQKSNGIQCEWGDFVMNGGTVVSNAGRGDESFGIYADKGITFNGGSFTGNGYYTTKYWSRGIKSDDTITVNGGTVTGTAPLDNDIGYGDYGFDNLGQVILNGGNLTAIGKKVFSNISSWSIQGGAGTQLRIFAGPNADSAALVDSIPEDANYVQIQVLYNVTITPGSNMTKTTDSGAQSQTALEGEMMTDVVYTADDGYYFPENYSVKAVNGISVTRDSFKQITISGTPTAGAAIKLTAPTAKTTPDAPATVAAVDCTSPDINDGKLTGVTTAMEYKKSDADSWTDGTGNDITGLLPGTYYVRLKATDTTNASGNRELTISVWTHSHEWATAWSNDDTYHWHACMGEGASDDCLKEEGAAKAEHTYGDTGDARFICTVCDYVDTNGKAAAAVAEAIDALPAAKDVTPENKDTIEAARAAYEKLTDKQKAKIDEKTLAKLEAVESALAVAEVKELPDAEDVTVDDKDTIEAARAAYDALSDEEKAKVPVDTVKKLLTVEAALMAADGTLTPEYVSELVNVLPAEGAVKTSDRDAIMAARASYDALTDKQKADAVEILAKLEVAETALTVETLPDADQVTANDAEAIKAARAAYEALTDEQKEAVGKAKLAKLETAETSLTVSALPAAGEVTVSDKEAIEAARAAYDALTDEQKEAVGKAKLAKLEAAETALALEALPAADEVTVNDKEAIEAARAAYNKLTDEQKAQVGSDKLAKLEAAENALVKELIEEITEADKVTTGDKEAIEAARAAYDALTDEQKEAVGSDKLEKLEATETALTVAEITDLTAADKVTADDKAAIKEARETYDNLTPEQKAQIGKDNLEKLEAAETALTVAEITDLTAADEVTADDEAAIKEARETYDKLTDEQKKKVGAEKLSKLAVAEAALAVAVLPAADKITESDKEAIEAARAAYDALTDEQKEEVGSGKLTKLAVAETALVIAALPESDKLTADDKNAVEAARAAYDALTDEQKEKVSEDVLKKLTDAEAEIVKIDQNAADAVTTKINNLPKNVTLNNKAAVREARAAYNALTKDQQKLVPADALTKLTNAEKTISYWMSYNKKAAKAKAVTTKITSVKNVKEKKAVVKWAKKSGITGYQVRYSINKNMKKNVKTVTINKQTTGNITVKKLKKKETYYFQVRTFTKVKNKATGKTTTVYGKWSGKKEVKIKK